MTSHTNFESQKMQKNIKLNEQYQKILEQSNNQMFRSIQHNMRKIINHYFICCYKQLNLILQRMIHFKINCSSIYLNEKFYMIDMLYLYYQQMMNLKQSISKFRSQILVGKYDAAISMGKLILRDIELLTQLGIISKDQLQCNIQAQYQKCLSINSLIHSKITVNDQTEIKKWQSKPKGSKWILPMRKSEPSKEETVEQLQEYYNEEEQQVHNSPVNQSCAVLLQNIEKDVMMPIRMPSFFKNVGTQYRVITVPEGSYSVIFNFFIQNEFMNVKYQDFRYQFNKSQSQNYFNQNGNNEIVIQSNIKDIQSIRAAKNDPCFKKHHCIFLICSENDEYEIK